MLDANDLKAIREIMLESENRMNKRFNKVDEEIKDIKCEIKELHHMDTLILDEVERVHGIFAKKTEELQEKIG